MLHAASLALAGGLLVGQASAHLGQGIPGHLTPRMQIDVAKRGMERRQSAYNDQTWQSVTKPSQECQGYNYAPTSSFTSHFPEIWEIASIVQSDTEAQSVWKKIKSSGKVPNIKPKGTPTSSEQGVHYDSNSDPDCWWTSTLCTKPKLQGIPVDIIDCPTPSTWGLTFDDGPNCTHNAFYDFLKSKKQTATMFYIGSNVLNWPLQAQRGLTDGHQLSAHTWSHRYTTALTDEQVFAELYYTVKAIKWVTGVTVTSWRPPYGDVDDRVRAIANELGLDTIIWTDDTDDWNVIPGGTAPTASIQANYASIISKGKGAAAESGGVVVLTHEINAQTMHMMMNEYPTIASTFKHVVPVHVCHNKTQPYREGSYVYPNFEQYVAGTIMPSGIPSATDITASAVSSIAVGAISSTSQATLSVSSTAAAASGSSAAGSSGASAAPSDQADAKNDKASGAVTGIAAAGSVALAAVGGAAALFV